MIEATLADLRSPKYLQQWDQVVHLVDARKKHSVGYFIPEALSDALSPVLEKLEQERKHSLLKKIAAAQLADPIEEGATADGIK